MQEAQRSRGTASLGFEGRSWTNRGKGLKSERINRPQTKIPKQVHPSDYATNICGCSMIQDFREDVLPAPGPYSLLRISCCFCWTSGNSFAETGTGSESPPQPTTAAPMNNTGTILNFVKSERVFKCFPFTLWVTLKKSRLSRH